MRVKCRGYEGDLTYLDVSDTIRIINREPVKIYCIWIAPDKNTVIELSNVKEQEIEVLR